MSESSEPGVEAQRKANDEAYANAAPDRFSFHDTRDPLIRYLRDRRMTIGLERLLAVTGSKPADFSVLVVCGGVGGEGSFFADAGFGSVTVSDLSSEALALCRARDPRLKTQVVDAEKIDLPNGSFDVVFVQDGLHHLPRPVLGFTEMLRIAKRAVIVIEPHTGIVAKLLGHVWEREGDAVNYVFRWNDQLLEQSTRSYLLEADLDIRAIRTWDHSLVMSRIGRRLGGQKLAVLGVRACYFVLNTLARNIGNMMIGVVVKQPRKP